MLSYFLFVFIVRLAIQLNEPVIFWFSILIGIILATILPNVSDDLVLALALALVYGIVSGIVMDGKLFSLIDNSFAAVLGYYVKLVFFPPTDTETP